jgi:hypothetical protein
MKAQPKKKKPISEKQRESDALREELRKFDLKKFDKALEKAIKTK